MDQQDPLQAPSAGEALTDAKKLLTLVTDRPSWIHRRVDRTHLDEDGESTRHVSFDLTISDRFAIRRSTGVVIPLTLMTKRPLRRLSSYAADGSPIPVLSRRDNGSLVEVMLLDAFATLSDEPLSEAAVVAVRSAVYEQNPDDMASRVDAIRAAFTARGGPEGRTELEVLLALAHDLTRQFLFAVVLPVGVVGQRTIVKIEFGEDFVSARDYGFTRQGRTVTSELQLEGSAASAHFELQAPAGLRIAGVRITDSVFEDLSFSGPALVSGSTAHLTELQEVYSPLGAVLASVELEPVPDGLTRQTALASGFVACLLFGGALGRNWVNEAVTHNRSGSLAAAALAVPALFLTLQSRRPEHAATARALSVPRALNFATAVILYVAAVYLVVSASTGPATSVLWLAAVLQTGVAALAIAFQRDLSDPASTVNRE